MRQCKGCGGEIPPTRDCRALWCSNSCKSRHISKEWHAKNKEYVNTQRRAWTKKNRDAVRSYARKWRDEHLPQARTNARRYYHRKVYGHDQFVDEPLKNYFDRFRAARALGYRSGLEVAVAEQLKKLGCDFEYEPFRIPFTQPQKPRHYLPDCVLPNGQVIELKGRMLTSDRQKMSLVRDQYPELDIRIVFSNPSQRISKQSKTTYAIWCESKGFKFAKGLIPVEWTKEPVNKASLEVIRKLRGLK